MKKLGLLLMVFLLTACAVKPDAVLNENAVKIEPAHRTSRAIASESKSHPEIGWL